MGNFRTSTVTRPRLRALLLGVSALSASAVLAVAGGMLTAGTAAAGPLAQPTCGKTLTSSVTLTANLDCSTYTSGPALVIGANNVTLNLNHFTITGPGGASSTAGVEIGSSSSSTVSHDTVENGTIENFDEDVYVEYAAYLDLTGLNLEFNKTASYYGIYSEYDLLGGKFSSITAEGAYIGIYLYGDVDVSISHATLSGDTYGYYGEYNTGIAITDSSANGGGSSAYGFLDYYAADASFTGDSANFDLDGFYIYEDGYGAPVFRSNHADNNTEYGFYLYENYVDEYGLVPHEMVIGNTADSNGYDGFYDYYSLGAVYTGNQANHNDEYGMLLYYPLGYNVTYNTASNNTDSGIYLEDNYSLYNVKTASDNITDSNEYYGIYAGYGTLASGNVAVGNTPHNCFNIECNQAPTVTGLSPKSGPKKGGTLVTIKGTNLLAPTAVHFGGTLAKIHKVVSANEIEVISPKGSGKVNVTVTTAGGKSATTAADRFTY